MINREDILRELELLPVWQLRHPVAVETTTDSSQSAQQESADYPTKKLASPFTFRLVASDDGLWLFALQSQHDEEAETLFHNMLKAVAVKIGQEVNEAQSTTMADYKPKVIVAMGEFIAQQLLSLDLPLPQLRGVVHTLKQTSVIVTYAPDDLLQNGADKANAWEDLCSAKRIVTTL